MRAFLLIDGYNLLRAWSQSRYRAGPGNLERARGALLGWLDRHVGDPAATQVVFDAAADRRPDREPGFTTPAGIEVHFAVDFPTADAMIAEMCQRHSAPRQLTVVSDDREVQRSARRRRAQVISCARFEQTLEKRTSSRTEEPEKPTEPNESQVDYWRSIFEKRPQAPED